MKVYFKSLKAVTILVVIALLPLFIACNSSNKDKNAIPKTKALRKNTSAKPVVKDTLQEEIETHEYLTYAKALEIVKPTNKTDEATIGSFFKDLELPNLLAERYICDEDWGGDTPAISYCFGNQVQYENYKLSPTGTNYYGLHFNFFFDDSRQTGKIAQLSIITSDKKWYEQFMKDAEADGMRFIKNLDRAIYQKDGKEYSKEAEKNEKTTESAHYYIFDYSKDDKFDLEIGYDSGLDI